MATLMSLRDSVIFRSAVSEVKKTITAHLKFEIVHESKVKADSQWVRGDLAV